jgi:phosphoglucosamine mutase
MNQLISFGTDGIRGHADNFPFTQEALKAIGTSIALWSIEKYSNPVILIGKDTRYSGPRVTQNLIEGLKKYNIKIVDGGILPTPAICQLIKNNKKFHCGIVISASHNPANDNGIKIFDAKTSKLQEQDENVIIKNFEKIFQKESYVFTQDNSDNKVERWDNAADEYSSFILQKFNSNFLSGIKIALDCANGATYSIAPEIFSTLGAKIITTGTIPDGENINKLCGSLYPQNLIKLVLENNADIGFAFDGDGDRLIVVNKNGEIKDGDDMLALLINLPEFCKTNTIVSTIMSNTGFEKHINSNQKKLIRTNVGDKYVSFVLEKEKLPLGGEPSGHIIIRDYLPTSDGIFVALKILESVIINNNKELITFKKYPQVSINLPVKHKRDLNLKPYSEIISSYEKILKNGRLIIRYSGTENILRIMAEAPIIKEAQDIADNLAKELQKELSKDF